MKKRLTYSILQYKHSVLLAESINVGIAFYFFEEKFVRFISTSGNRVKLIYPDFDITVFNYIIQSIESKVVGINVQLSSIFPHIERNVFTYLLRPDDSALQFSESKTISYPFLNTEKIVSAYSDLLLVQLPDKKNEEQRHSEDYLLKTFHHQLFDGNKDLEKIIRRDVHVESNGISLTFNYGWKNGTLNLIKPVSFDFKEKGLFQPKSLAYFGFLTKLGQYARNNNLRYDLLLSAPQDQSLLPEFEKAVEIIGSADSPKKVILENELPDYTVETRKYLKKFIEENLSN